MKNLMIFLGGALVGAAAAALFTPEKGEDLRYKLRTLLKKRGVVPADQIDTFVEIFAAEIEDR